MSEVELPASTAQRASVFCPGTVIRLLGSFPVTSYFVLAQFVHLFPGEL